MIYTEAIIVNPSVHLEKGKSYPFLDMASVDPSSRCAWTAEWRPFAGGGARFAVGDTLLARITPCLENGKIARYCGQLAHEAHGSTEFIVIRGRGNITDSAYAYYLTKWQGVSGYAISQMTGTSGRQRVPTDSLSNLLVPIPPLPEQRRIAHILGTLDDKIENNRKTAKTLEAMAQAIFKSWFVDFDPVRAKMNGEPRESICFQFFGICILCWPLMLCRDYIITRRNVPASCNYISRQDLGIRWRDLSPLDANH